MPDYRKKRRNGIFSSPAKVKKSRIQKDNINSNIVMSSSKRPKNKAESKGAMRVVKGKKLEQRRRNRIGLVVISLIAVLIAVLQLILPAGIIETASNGLALLGSGSYPIELESTETLDTVSRGLYYYVLTNEEVNAFSNSGKKLFSYYHGFENPIIKTSQTRAIVFSQGGTQALVFDLRGLITDVTTNKSIITAAISDSGRFAIASRSDKYTAEVKVYDKRAKTVYEWYSAEDTVNNIALSANGKKIAVSTFNSASGQYKATLNVLNFKSATPEYKESFENTLIYTINSTHRSAFTVVTSGSIKFIKWSNFKSKEYKNDYPTAFFRAGKGGYLAVFNRESDKTDNRIALFSKSGELKAELKYKGIISDIQVSSGHIYCINDTEINLLSNEGEILRNASCGFGVVKLSVTGTNSVAVITDNKIERIKLEQEQKK